MTDQTEDRDGLTPRQYDYLVKPISPDRVRQSQGQSHVEAWDVRRTLIRIFGFGGYNLETKRLDLIAQIEIPAPAANGRSRWTVIYRADVRLTVKDQHGREVAHFEDSATGDSANQPSLGDAHDMAVKTALSQALKRCATNLGDQFGLSLYNKGSVGPVVVGSLVSPMSGQPAVSASDAPAVVGGEMDERTERIREPEDTHSEAPTVDPVVTAREDERLALINSVAEAAKAAGVDLSAVLGRWAAEHDGQHIREATDLGSLELYRDELLTRAQESGAA